MPDFAACWYLLLIMNPVTKNFQKTLLIHPDWSWKSLLYKNNTLQKVHFLSNWCGGGRILYLHQLWCENKHRKNNSMVSEIEFPKIPSPKKWGPDSKNKKTTLFSHIIINLIEVYLSKNISILLCMAAWLLPQKYRSKKAKKWIEKERSVVYEIVYLSRSSAHSCFSSSLASFDWFWMRRANWIARGLMRIVK